MDVSVHLDSFTVQQIDVPYDVSQTPDRLLTKMHVDEVRYVTGEKFTNFLKVFIRERLPSGEEVTDEPELDRDRIISRQLPRP